MTMIKTGVINRKDGKSTLNFKCSCGRVHRAVATLGQVSCGAYVQPTVDIAVEELALHPSAEGSPEGGHSSISDEWAQLNGGVPQTIVETFARLGRYSPKHWIPKLIAGAWGIGFYDGDAWEGDGGPFTHAEALRLVKWLNEQERLIQGTFSHGRP